MTENTQQDTRQLIFDAAYELFAEHGFEHVSTRMIAEKAGVALGGIHYHFQNKEGLYGEVLRLAADASGALNIDDLLTENPHLLDTDEGKCEAIRRMVEDHFSRSLENVSDRRKKIVFREMGQHSPSELLDKVLKPDLERNYRFFKMLKPNGSEEEAFIWGHLPNSQSVFHIFVKAVLERIAGKEHYDKIRCQLVRQTTKMMILMLGLPLPKDLEG